MMEAALSPPAALSFPVTRSFFRSVAVFESSSFCSTCVAYKPQQPIQRVHSILKSRHISYKLVCNLTKNGVGNQAVSGAKNDGFMEVIGLGSRIDSIIDVCANSPFQSALNLRYWNVDATNSTLQKLRMDNGSAPKLEKIEQFLNMDFKAFILVAGAGYLPDHEMVLNILESLKARNVFTVAILLRPFSFEGQRRRDEMNSLMLKLKEFTSFCIDIDTDQLLKNDLVTLDEALKTANTAVLLAVNSISVLLSDGYQKLIHCGNQRTKEIDPLKIIGILAQYDAAKVGFGIGDSITNSVSLAFSDCPFVCSALESFNGIVFCSISSSDFVDDKVDTLLEIHNISKHNGEIIFSWTYEPNLEPNTFVTTLFVFGSPSPASTQSITLMSRLSQYVPFFLKLFTGNKSQPIPENAKGEETEPVNGKFNAISDSEIDYVNEGPGYEIAQKWAKERVGIASTYDSTFIVSLPVGVKPVKNGDGNGNHKTEKKNEKAAIDTMLDSSSWDAVKDIYVSASSLLKGKSSEVPKKQSMLSVRAASMLDAERHSPAKWNPTVEMRYRGGVYRGRCQGGLPEGKGILNLGDGSVYDGLWRYGKRCGHGTFYFGNGDVFHGYWREDVMHGKGWYYFHTGDRWFANFWKGRADGESRFYSKDGHTFFGNFRDGWRHGDILCIGVDGVRFLERWQDGLLLSRTSLDSSSF